MKFKRSALSLLVASLALFSSTTALADAVFDWLRTTEFGLVGSSYVAWSEASYLNEKHDSHEELHPTYALAPLSMVQGDVDTAAKAQAFGRDWTIGGSAFVDASEMFGRAGYFAGRALGWVWSGPAGQFTLTGEFHGRLSNGGHVSWTGQLFTDPNQKQTLSFSNGSYGCQPNIFIVGSCSWAPVTGLPMGEFRASYSYSIPVDTSSVVTTRGIFSGGAQWEGGDLDAYSDFLSTESITSITVPLGGTLSGPGLRLVGPGKYVFDTGSVSEVPTPGSLTLALSGLAALVVSKRRSLRRRPAPPSGYLGPFRSPRFA